MYFSRTHRASKVGPDIVLAAQATITTNIIAASNLRVRLIHELKTMLSLFL